VAHEVQPEKIILARDDGNSCQDDLRKYGLACGAIEVLGGGQINAIFRVDGVYVVRIGAGNDAAGRLEREAILLQNLDGRIPVPKLIASGEESGFYYQLQGFVPGKKLYQVWREYNSETQDSLAAELAAALRTLHSAGFPSFGETRPESKAYAAWGSYLTEKFYATLQEICDLRIRMFPGFIEMAVEYFEENRSVLEGGTPCLVHSDMNLGNLLVDQGKIAALLDFEFALHAPADYELQVIEAFCLYPNDWAEEGNEIFCTADFANLIPLLRRHYPELFAIRNLRRRLDLYHIYSALNSYLAWRKANLSTIPPERMAAKNFYLGRITNILWDHGARLFWA
jgi:aminoglycoside phosphotransferase (APT) family kinase protein